MAELHSPQQFAPGNIQAPETASRKSKSQLHLTQAHPTSRSHNLRSAQSEYAVTEISSTVAIPEGLDPVDASTIPAAGLMAYQSIVPYVKSGNKVFINDGSVGTGCFGIQIVKDVG